MKKSKAVLGIVSIFAGMVMMMSTSLGLSVFAATSQPPAPSNKSEQTENTSIPESGEYSITGYRVYTNPSGQTPIQITSGLGIQVRVDIFDTRVEKMDPDKLKPVARLNTGAFTSYNGMEPVLSNMRFTNGGFSYSLDFPLVYTGTGNSFSFDLFYLYKPNSEKLIQLDIPLVEKTITLNNCVEKDADNSGGDDSSSSQTRGTGFVLKDASYGGPNVQSGKTFDFNAEIMATNGSYGVDNVTVTLTPPQEITVATGSTNTFIGSVSPNQTFTVSYQLKASAAIAEAGSYKITLEITGANAKDGTEVTTTIDVSVPIIPLERFEITNVQVPETLVAGNSESVYASARLVNKGKGTIYNVSAEIIGDGLTTEEGFQFIGNVAPGTDSEADFNIRATDAGQIDAQLVVTFENDQGEEKKLVHKFTVNVEDGGMNQGIDSGADMSYPPIEPISEEMPIWVWFAVGGLFIVGVVIIIVIIRKKKKAKQEAELEEEDDEDF